MVSIWTPLHANIADKLLSYWAPTTEVVVHEEDNDVLEGYKALLQTHEATIKSLKKRNDELDKLSKKLTKDVEDAKKGAWGAMEQKYTKEITQYKAQIDTLTSNCQQYETALRAAVEKNVSIIVQFNESYMTSKRRSQ